MKKWIQFSLCMLTIAAFFGCGVKRPAPLFEAQALSEKLKSGDYTQEVDNFLILLDASHTMRDYHIGEKKFCLAKATAYALNDTIAGLALTSGVRLFGNLKVFSANTSIVCTMHDYSADEFVQCLDKLNASFGNTPIYEALEAAAGDIENLQGKTAIIIISDGIYSTKSPMEAVKILKDKYGDNVCISTIAIGSSDSMNAIAGDSKCGVAVSFNDVNTSEGMTDFAEKVFLAKKPPMPKKPAVPKPAPVPVVQEEKIILSSIMFDFNSSIIKPEFAVLLEETAKILQRKSDKNIVIEGHACSLGTAEYNQWLSERRAIAIKQFLVSKGVAAARLTAKGVGKQRPIADNTTKEGRKRNRRVEFLVMQ